jgi:hypothetical protein
MTAPVVGAAARAASGTAATGAVARAGGKVPRGTRAARNKAAKQANAATPTTPANSDNSTPAAPKPKTDNTVPAGTPAPAQKPSAPMTMPNITTPKPVSSGAGFILGLLFWTWVALPFLKDGVPGVRKQLKAKFTNKAPDGSYLP